MLDSQPLIDGYLDDTLTPDQHVAFKQWLAESPENRRTFAEAVLLHDRLRSECLAMAETSSEAHSFTTAPVTAALTAPRQQRRRRSAAAMFAAVLMVAVVMAVLWKGLGGTPAAAAVTELKRLIAANAHATDRTYQVSVEESDLPREQAERRKSPESGRPPKPPIDGAVLHVRAGNQFVLIRTTRDGLPFVTGSNGQTSWAARPDGPVRVSSDLTRFNRDLPGHEYAMPLINIDEGLERLRVAYDLQLLPMESADSEIASEDEPLRLLVAIKKRGYRGPRRVEITYAMPTGQIRQLRFVDMPYGPERLTLRLTLVEERNLGAAYFDHTSHHRPERTVEFEE